MSAEVVLLADRRQGRIEPQPDDPHRARHRDIQRRLTLVASRLADLEDRHINITFQVIGKALDWFDRKGALE